MSRYPTSITPDILAHFTHIPDEELLRDIHDTEREEVEARETADAHAKLAEFGPPHERRMAAFRASAYRERAQVRREFADYLQRLYDARHPDEEPEPVCPPSQPGA